MTKASISILGGIYADDESDFRASFPKNLIPVPQQTGISTGYLRPAYGITSFTTGEGIDRAAIVWKDNCYRISGTKFIKIDNLGTKTIIGDIPGSYAKITEGDGYLSITGGGNLYYYDGTTLSQVTDPDLGSVIDHTIIDGFVICVDSNSIFNSKLSDKTQFDALDYAEASDSPDKIVNVFRIGNELCVVGTNTVQAFQNTGSVGFAFSSIRGATSYKGAICTSAACKGYIDSNAGIFFVGAGQNEPPSLWFYSSGQSTNISIPEIDSIFLEIGTSNLISNISLEYVVYKGQSTLYIHTANKTICYAISASQTLGRKIFYTLSRGNTTEFSYPARNFVYCYDKMLCGSSLDSSIGQIDETSSSYFGESSFWEFSIPLIYADGEKAIVKSIEIVALTGNNSSSSAGVISTSYSNDGRTFSPEVSISTGSIGDYAKRIVFLTNGYIQNWRTQRFKGENTAHLSIAKLLIDFEELI